MKNDENFNLIGFSQGGLLGRALIQNCPEVAAKVKNFISIGSPQNGVSEFPRCDCVIKGRHNEK